MVHVKVGSQDFRSIQFKISHISRSYKVRNNPSNIYLRIYYVHIVYFCIFSEFIDTAVTDNDWVCDLVTRPTDLFTLGCVGLILGTAVFSWLADAKGRRLAFFFSTLAMIIFQLIQIGVSHEYAAFLTMKVRYYFFW